MKLKAVLNGVGVLLALGLFASPVTELYPGHTTFYLNFDDGTGAPSVGDVKAQGKPLVGEGGMFGSKGLLAGGPRYSLPKGQKVFDTKKPGTLVFWLKLVEKPTEIPKYEPGETFFSADWSPTRRILVFRQGNLGWGGAGIDGFFEGKAPDGKRVTARVGQRGKGTMKTWEVGEWHMCAFVWRPDGLEFSWDGLPFAKTVNREVLGAFSGAIRFGLYPIKGKETSHYVMDECSILDFKLSDDQVKELHDEYRAMMGESRKLEGAPEVTIEKMGRGKTASAWDVVLKVRNPGAKARKLAFDFSARPVNSQPVKKHEEFSLAAGAEKLLKVSGPVLDDEKILVEMSVKSANGRYVCFNRARVFAPNAEEPEWMRAPSAVSFKFAYYPYENTVHASADITGCDDFEKVKTFRLAILRKGAKGKPVATKAFAASPDGKTEFFWTGLPELDGEYVCTLVGEGLEAVKAEQPFLRRRFPWEKNLLGKSDAIPAPFEKIVRLFDCSDCSVAGKHDHVKVVLRDHALDKKTGLWKQVNAAGKDLLARPMALVSGNRTIEQSEQSNNFAASAEWDVDGLMLWRLTLKPGHYEPMALEIPMKPERAWLYHECADGLRNNSAGRIPAGTGRVWDSTMAKGRSSIVGTYLPYVWVGGPLRGISVFGENDRGWVIANTVPSPSSATGADKGSAREDASSTVPCQEIVREPDGTVVLKLNLIQIPVDITEERTIKIGFMATPVKPMLENWRSKEHGSLLGACYYWGGFWDSHAVEPFDGTDEFFRVMGEERRTGVENKEYITRCIEAYPYPYKKGTPEYEDHHRRIAAHYGSGHHNAAWSFKRKNELVFYTNGRGVHYGDPKGQGATFCNEWNRFEYMDREFTIMSMRAYDLDPVESYRDYAAWWYERMLGTGACDHLYWDDVFCQSSFNLVQTDAYRLPTGQIQPSSGIFNMREQVKRCAVLQTEMGKDARGNWVHMTNTAMAPVLAFAGVNYDWEDSSGTNPPQVKYPSDYILACTIGRQFGNRVGIMGYFDFSLDKKGEKYRYLERCRAGVMIAHELRCGGDAYKAVHDKLVAWGYRKPETQVWNYWDEDVAFPVTVKGGDFPALAMAKWGSGLQSASNEVLVVVSSFNADDRTVTIAPDAKTLGLASGFKAYDFETGAEIPLSGGVASLSVPAYDFKVVQFK